MFFACDRRVIKKSLLTEAILLIFKFDDFFETKRALDSILPDEP